MPHQHWNNLGKNLVGIFPYIEKMPQGCFWEADIELETFGQNYRYAEKPYLEEIKSCIEGVCRDRCHVVSSLEVAYFLGVRSAVIESFVLRLSISTSHEQIGTVFLLPPDMSTEDAIRWLFLDWWEGHGPLCATYQRIADIYIDNLKD